jgi:hypothetical protein
VPPSFDDLVSKASLIFVGEVVDQESRWETIGEHRSIVTVVTFDVASVLKGTVGLRTQLTFQGGQIGDLKLDVSDMPKFQTGERDVLFVSPEQRAVSPLVGFSYGRFQVVADPTTGDSLIRTSDGQPVMLGLGAARAGVSAQQLQGPLTLSSFASAVRQKVQSSLANR